MFGLRQTTVRAENNTLTADTYLAENLAYVLHAKLPRANFPVLGRIETALKQIQLISNKGHKKNCATNFLSLTAVGAVGSRRRQQRV